MNAKCFKCNKEYPIKVMTRCNMIHYGKPHSTQEWVCKDCENKELKRLNQE